MPQAITQSYDFRKTYFRNFYNNRREGMVKGLKFGRLARMHSKKVTDDTTHDGTVWNKNLGIWEQSSNADYVGAISLLDVLKNGTVSKDGVAKVPKKEEDKYYKALNQDIVDAIIWMEENKLHLADPYDHCAYRVSTLAQPISENLNLTPGSDEYNRHYIIETAFKTEFVKMTKKTDDRTMNSFSYKMTYKATPAISSDNIMNRDVPLYSHNDGKCIFYPNTNIVVPDVGMTDDLLTWDLSGSTSIIGRQESGKYLCDIIDSTDNGIIANEFYELPTKYKNAEAVLPSPANVIQIPDAVKNAISLIMYKRRDSLRNSVIHVGTDLPVFSGIYVSPVCSLYMELIEMREISNSLVN